MNHFLARPRNISTDEILNDIRAQAPHRNRNSAWDTAKAIVVGAFCLALIWYLYWPVARGLAWGTLWICKACGLFTPDLPPYTPYPNDI